MTKLQRFINLLGYKSVRFNRDKNLEVKNNFSYESLLFKRYAPWQDDEQFIRLYHEIKQSTLVDIYRLYELFTLARQLPDIEGAVLEVGAWRGGSSVIIARAFSHLPNKPTIYCCDTFQGVANATAIDREYKGGEHADTSITVVRSLFEKQGVKDIKILQGIFPEETASLISDTAFRFCHIDVDVYQSAKNILEYVWPKLSVSGIVVFDDYGFISCNGVTTLVNDLMLKGCTKIYNLNGHAILIKTRS